MLPCMILNKLYLQGKLVLAHPRKRFSRLLKIFVEHARHVASAGSVVTIGLSRNGCSHSKKPV